MAYTRKQRHQDLLDVIACARSTDNLSAYDGAMSPISRLIDDSSGDSQADGYKESPVQRSYVLTDTEINSIRAVVSYLLEDEYNITNLDDRSILHHVDVLDEYLRYNTEDV